MYLVAAGLALLLPFAIAAALRAALVVIAVYGSSMAPTLSPGDRVLVFRWWPHRRLRHGLVVLLKPTPQLLNSYAVKRIAGLPGDTFRSEPGDPGAHPRASNWTGVVPHNHVYVIGDDPNSLDSSGFGPVPLRFLDGVVIARLRSKDSRFVRR
jgi:signal peptidase I